MREPLALLFYEHLLTGSQLLNRLRDLGYRTEVVNEVEQLPTVMREKRPLLLFAELGVQGERLTRLIHQLRTAPETRHVPVLTWQEEGKSRAARRLAETARAAGATVLPPGRGLLAQLPLLLAQVLDQGLD